MGHMPYNVSNQITELYHNIRSPRIKYLLGQVGGFPLRLSWLPRFVACYHNSRRVPRDMEVVARELGMGKNMVKSMLVWAFAAGIIDDERQLTSRATRLFMEDDPYLERGESIALLHWLICSNTEYFTANTWLFNYCLLPNFSPQDAVVHFNNFLENDGAKYASGTIKSDIETAIRMHASANDQNLDNVDDKFFYPLRLINQKKIDRRTIFVRSWEHSRYQVTQKVLFYALLQCLANRRTARASLMSDLYSAQPGHAALGVVFGLTRDGFFIMMESLVNSNTRRLMLTAMPGGDFIIQVKGRLGNKCEAGNIETADHNYF